MCSDIIRSHVSDINLPAVSGLSTVTVLFSQKLKPVIYYERRSRTRSAVKTPDLASNPTPDPDPLFCREAKMSVVVDVCQIVFSLVEKTILGEHSRIAANHVY